MNFDNNDNVVGEGREGGENREIGDDTRGGGADAYPTATLITTDCLALRVKRTVMLHDGDLNWKGEEG